MSSPPPRARSDLEYRTVQMGEDEVVVIADPVRGSYFKYNPLQAEMLQALDGRRTLPQVLEELGERYEMQISRRGAEKFLEQLQSRLLLDVAAYPLPQDGPMHARICRSLRRRGYAVNRSPSARSTLGPPPEHPERALLHGALSHLERGRLQVAKEALVALRELRPEDADCRALLLAMQDAFIRASSPSTTDFPALPLLNPDRALGALDRLFGRFLFSAAGMAGLVALLVAAVAAWVDTSLASVQIGPWDVAGGFLAFIAAMFLHEVAHGLACKHYGGSVREMGLFLLYYVQPVPYCDTSSSYLFPLKRQKIIVQLAGTLGSVVASAWLALLLWLLPPFVAVYPALLVGFGLNTGYAVLLNSLPLIKLDGYYALADALEIPNLRERAFEYCTALLARALLGKGGPDLPEVKPRERRVFLFYAPLAATFSVLWIGYAYTRFLVGPLLGRYQGLGLLLGLSLAAVLSWRVTGRPLLRAAAFAVKHRRQLSRPRLWLAAAAAVAAPALVLLCPWPSMVDVPFTVAPLERAQVRAEVEGRVDAVAVREGERVERGQLLARLRNEALAADLAAVEASVEAARDRLRLLERGPRPEAVELLSRRLERALASLRWERGRASRLSGHAARGLDSNAAAADAASQVERASAEADALREEEALARAGARVEQLEAARAEVAKEEARRDGLRAAAACLELRSPIAGTVVTARPEELIGRHLAPGALLLEVHDLERVRGELALGPSSPLGDVRPEDAVALVAEGLPHLRVDSRVERLAPASGATELLAYTRPFALQGARSGMHGRARIYGERRSLGSTFLLQPLRRFLGVELWSLF